MRLLWTFTLLKAMRNMISIPSIMLFEILKYAHPVEFKELLDAFDKFYILKSDLLVGGGSESKIPKRFCILLETFLARV